MLLVEGRSYILRRAQVKSTQWQVNKKKKTKYNIHGPRCGFGSLGYQVINRETNNENQHLVVNKFNRIKKKRKPGDKDNPRNKVLPRMIWTAVWLPGYKTTDQAARGCSGHGFHSVQQSQ